MITVETSVALECRYGAQIYEPLELVVASAAGCWLTDVNGKRYLDCLSAYSAVNQGHCHPRIVAAVIAQAGTLTITARALHNTVLPRFLERLCAFAGYDQAIPMNTGAEAVETALKVARRWGYSRKGIPDGQAEVIVCDGNFHGRTTTIVGFSSVAQYRAGFGPFAGGFRSVPFGDLDALAAAIGPNTCAFLVEPIQAEGGVVLPPDGYLRAAQKLCCDHNVLFIADEIQTGLGRAGARFACDREQVVPDVLVLGKALSGGMSPVSAVLAPAAIMSTLKPGDHGSTFGGNPLGAAVAIAALDVLEAERLAERAAAAGAKLLAGLRALSSPLVVDVRGAGLLIGMEFTVPARRVADALLRHGVAAKDTHGAVLRLTPPLIINDDEIAFLLAAMTSALKECA